MELKPALCTSVFSLVLILCILLSEHRAASQAVVGGMVMSKPVSNSCCCFGAAAQSKSLSVGHLEQKQAQIEAEATAFTAQQCSPWLRGEGFQLFTWDPSIMLSHTSSSTRCLREYRQHFIGIPTLELRFSHTMSVKAVMVWKQRHLTLLQRVQLLQSVSISTP